MNDFVAVRRKLHQLAELSGNEHFTANFIRELASQFSPTQILHVPNSHTLLVEYCFSETGKTVLFRADMDALPINETLAIPYQSKTAGVSHKCGHDGHSAILLQLAERLQRQPLKRGRVLLLFQAAEETGGGAERCLNSKILNPYPIDFAFALHNIPCMPKNAIICKSGSFTCSVVSCDIVLRGKTAHAAEPWNGISPLPAATELLDNILQWNVHDAADENYTVVTLIELQIGEKAYGVAAGEGILRLTMRTKTDALLQQKMRQTEDLLRAVAEKTPELVTEIIWKEHFAANENDERAVTLIEQACANLQLPHFQKDTPFSWGEDFGLFTQKYCGAMFGLGGGEEEFPLHHPHYDFPDDIIETGSNIFYNIAEQICN